jgi:hypothetical protein
MNQTLLFAPAPRLVGAEPIASSLARPGEIRGFTEVGWGVGKVFRA